jgi:hypothetical protein
MDATRNPLAGGTLTTRIDGFAAAALAIHQLRKRHRGHVFPNAGGARENQALRKGAALGGLGQQPEYMLVPEDVSKGHAPDGSTLASLANSQRLVPNFQVRRDFLRS